MHTMIYREQHGRIRQIVRDLLGCETSGASDLEVRTLLGRLTGTVKVHLTGEDSALYPRLLAHLDDGVREKAKEFHDSMGSLAGAYGAFAQKWTSGTILRDDRTGFFREFRDIADTLCRGIDLEDRELYTMADENLAVAG